MRSDDAMQCAIPKSYSEVVKNHANHLKHHSSTAILGLRLEIKISAPNQRIATWLTSYSYYLFRLGQIWSSVTWSFWHFWQYNWLFLFLEWVYVLAADIHNVVQMAKTLVDHCAPHAPGWANFLWTWECLPWWAWVWALLVFSELSIQIPMLLEQLDLFPFRRNLYQQILDHKFLLFLFNKKEKKILT